MSSTRASATVGTGVFLPVGGTVCEDAPQTLVMPAALTTDTSQPAGEAGSTHVSQENNIREEVDYMEQKQEEMDGGCLKRMPLISEVDTQVDMVENMDTGIDEQIKEEVKNEDGKRTAVQQDSTESKSLIVNAGPATKDNPGVLKIGMRKRRRGKQESVGVKDEPVYEEYDKTLAPANAFSEHLKDEPETEDKDNLKIITVFSLGGASSSNGPATKDNPGVLKNCVRKRQRGKQERVKIKNEPIDEEYNKTLAPNNAVSEHMKDEPETVEDKDNLKISAVFSLAGASTPNGPATKDNPKVLRRGVRQRSEQERDNLKISAVFSLGGASSPNASPVLTTTQAQGQLSCVACTGCKKILKKGQTAYQKKDSSHIFCSTECVTLYSLASSPIVKPSDTKTCHYCLKEVLELKHLIKAPVDTAGTIKDFCSQTCLSSVNFNRNSAVSTLSGEIKDNDRRGIQDLLRMDVEDFNYLLGKVEPLLRKRVSKMRRTITARERLSVTLRFLATGESFRSLCFQYQIARTTVSQIVMETCEALYDVLKEDHFKTPTTEAEWREVARGFQEKWQFPHCIGAIDGKHIHYKLYKPKSRFAVGLMAIVDADYKFIYAKFGMQGRVSDAGLFDQSDLRTAMDRDILNVPCPEPLPDSNITMPYAFIGDEAFPLWTELIKPYPYQTLDCGQRIFNYRLSRARRTVENAFGILANRLRVFLTDIALEPEKVAMITLAALSVHNFLREKASEAYLPPAFVDVEDENHRIINGAWRSDGELTSVTVTGARNATRMAKEQRDQLKTYFISPAGSLPWQENMI